MIDVEKGKNFRFSSISCYYEICASNPGPVIDKRVIKK